MKKQDKVVSLAAVKKQRKDEGEKRTVALIIKYAKNLGW